MDDYHRPMTFAGGPTFMPPYLKEKLRLKLFDADHSLLEVNSNSKEFQQIVESARSNIRNLLKVPNHSQIWFLGGGCHLLFASLPMNYQTHGKELITNYTTTGYFSKLSFHEAQKFSQPKCIADLATNQKGLFYLPESYDFAPNAAYTHFIDNQSVEGIEYPDQKFPVVPNIPLFDDCSSSFLTKTINWDKVDMAYAHAQKNCGTSGLTVMIIGERALKTQSHQLLPEICSFENYKKLNGYYADMNVIPIYSNYVMTQEMLNRGGLDMNNYVKRSQRLYSIIDKSSVYEAKVEPNVRSRISVTWNIKDQQILQKCLSEGAAQQLYEFKGHRSTGGLRASLFAPIPDQSVYRLGDFLEEFAQKYQ